MFHQYVKELINLLTSSPPGPYIPCNTSPTHLGRPRIVFSLPKCNKLSTRNRPFDQVMAGLVDTTSADTADIAMDLMDVDEVFVYFVSNFAFLNVFEEIAHQSGDRTSEPFRGVGRSGERFE